MVAAETGHEAARLRAEAAGRVLQRMTSAQGNGADLRAEAAGRALEQMGVETGRDITKPRAEAAGRALEQMATEGEGSDLRAAAAGRALRNLSRRRPSDTPRGPHATPGTRALQRMVKETPQGATRRARVADPVPMVIVRALGHVSEAHLRNACRTILESYPLRCFVGPPRDVLDFKASWDDRRGQLDARLLLDTLFQDRDPRALVELNVTGLDLFEGERPYVFGLANLSDRVAVVSLARIDPDPLRPSVLARKRIHKLVLHEVGHALGLPHHDDPACVMRRDATPRSLDSAPNGLCQVCHGELLARARLLSYPGQAALDQVRGHLARGELEDARFVLVRALWTVPLDAGLLNTFALAFLERGQWNEAISLLDLALERSPEFAEAHVNRGVALQMRRGPGDLARALAHFERALELRPGWGTVQSHLAGLYRARARAQGPAAR